MKEVKFLRLNILGLLAMGLWIEIKSNSSFKRNLYFMYGILILAVYVTFNITQLIEMFRVMNNLELLLENIGITMLIFIGFVKLSNIRFRWTRVRSIVEKMEKAQDIIYQIGGDAVDIYKNSIKYNEVVIKVWGTLVFSNVITCFIVRVGEYWINGPQEIYNNKIPLMFSSWFPYDKYARGNYEIIYALQFYCCTMAAYVGAFCDTFNVSFILFGIGQFYQLQHKIRNLHVVRDSNTNVVNTDESHIVDPYNEVIEIIKHHTRIIEFFKDVSDYMSPVLFLQFMIYSLIICTFGLEIMSDQPIRIAFGIQTTSSLLVELFFYYWYANEATLESLNISRAVGESEWYRLSPRAKKALLIMMMRADRPIEISVGGVHTMCLDSYVSLIKSAYSFVALFRQMSE